MPDIRNFFRRQKAPRKPVAASTDSGDAFALALYGVLRQRPGNLSFSPFGIRMALALAHVGARGDTAAQMANVLGLEAAGIGDPAAPFGVLARFDDAERLGLLRVANALWIQEGLGVEPAFLDEVASRFRGECHAADFAADWQRARNAINGWVANRTWDTIPEVLPSGQGDPLVRLMIVNALYFNANWESPFPTRATVDGAFELTPGRTVKVPFMHQRTYAAYCVSDGCRAVDLAYEGGDFSMSVIVPDERCALEGLERRLTPDVLRRLTDSASEREVDLELPRFKIRTSLTGLTAALRDTGLTVAFDRLRADFSGINGLRPPEERALYISDVLQQAFVSTSEAGTEASAATVVRVRELSAPDAEKPPEILRFRADHPFLFAIRDWRSGAILFLGRVVDPSHS
jgi:serpin B